MELPKVLAKRTFTAGLRQNAKRISKSLAQKQGTAPDLAVGQYDACSAKPAEHFTAGFGKAKMVPPNLQKKRYYMAGYGPYKPVTDILDPPYAHAVWLDDNSGRGGILMVSLDCVGMLYEDVCAIRRSMQGFTRMTGCRSIDICATHSHAGIDTMGMWGPLPISGKDKTYMQIVFAAVKVACELAYRDCKEGDLYQGQIEVEDMQRDPRLPQVYSKTMTRLRFVPCDGSRETHIINFAGHAELLGSRNTLLSADWPCYFRSYIRKQTGAETILFQGAIGGMISMLKQDEDPITSVARIGEKMGEFALAITNEQKLTVVINQLRQEIYMPCSNPLFITFGKTGVFKTEIFSRPDPFYNVALKTELNYLEIGELRSLLVPGELFPELMMGDYLTAETSGTGKGAEANPLPLREIARDDNLLVFGLANAELGYIVPPNDFLLDPDAPCVIPLPKDRLGRKHYEETNSTGILAASVIADTFTKMMEKVQAGNTGLN